MQVAVNEREQRELGDLIASQRRDDAARVPVPVPVSQGERRAFEYHGESLRAQDQR